MRVGEQGEGEENAEDVMDQRLKKHISARSKTMHKT